MPIKFAKNTKIAPPNGTENVKIVVIPPPIFPKFSEETFSRMRRLTLGHALADMYAKEKRNIKEIKPK